MHIRRFACLLLGLWLGGILFMGTAASLNLRSVEWIIEDAPQQVHDHAKRLGGSSELRMLLRYHSAIQNRALFGLWEWTQIGIGLILFGLLLFGTHEGKFTLAACLGMLLITAVMHFAITPGLIGLGRELDFSGPEENSVLRQQFQARHVAYSVMELVKAAFGLVLGAMLIWGQARRKSATAHPNEMVEQLRAVRP